MVHPAESRVFCAQPTNGRLHLLDTTVTPCYLRPMPTTHPSGEGMEIGMAEQRKRKSAAKSEVVVAYKGLDKNLACRGYQFEVGKTFLHDGPVERCKSGFHACENPLDVFGYYAPGESRFALVELSGALSREDSGDSKIAAGQITLKAELKIPELVAAAIKFVTGLCSPATSQHATGDQSASSATGHRSASSATGDQSASSATGYRSASSATGDQSASSATGDQSASSATGDRSASSATGYRSASSATGYRSASSATGDQSASSATGYRSASSATGDQSASSATGDQSASSATGYRSASSATGYRSASSASGKGSVAMSIGYASTSSAGKGGAIVCVYRDDDWNLVHIRASKVGDNGIKPDTAYTLDKDGEFVEVSS